MRTKRYKRKNARGILTPKERFFLNNIPEDRLLNSNERHYVSSIRNKTRKALEDLDLIFEELPYDVYSLFPKGKVSSLKRAIEEVTEILYYQNHPRLPKRLQTQNQKKTTSRKTRKQIGKIVDSVLAKLETRP